MFLREIDRLLSAHDPRWHRRLAVVFVLALLSSAAVVIRPLPIKFLLEPPDPASFFGMIERLADNPSTRLWLYVGVVLAIELLILALRMAVEFRVASLSERINRSIRDDIVVKLLRAPWRAKGGGGAGTVLAAASGDVESVQRLMREALVATGVSVLQLALMLVVIFFVELWLFWILAIEILVLAGAIALYAHWRKKQYLIKMAIEENFLGLLSSLYQKNLDIRFTGLGAMFLNRLAALVRRLFYMQLLLWRRHAAYHGMVEFVIGISAALCLVLLFVLSEGGPPPVGKFLVFAYYTVLIFPNLSQIGEAWPMINDARAALGRIEQATAGAFGLHHVQRTPARFGDIVFDDVSFTNDRGETILDRVSFTIRPGEKVTLFGESGTGKTTILTLLLGLQKPSGGRVTIGGRDVTDMSLADIKRFFVFARAHPAFLPGRVEENVVLHRAPNESTLASVLDRSRLTARLAAEPQGGQAAIGDKGEPFSGGEQQRLAFARVLLSDAPCLILDEALNSLDEESELWIMRRLIEETPGRTTLVVSHRRSAASLFPYRLELARGGKITIFKPGRENLDR